MGKRFFALQTLQATKYSWLEYNNCVGATLATLSLFTFFFFFMPEQREVPPITARDCQWTFIVTYICCEVQMKQMFCKRAKMISLFSCDPFHMFAIMRISKA